MQCPQCQQANPDAARFCNGCGARLDSTCPECGQTNPPGSRFCNGCGFKLTAPSSTAPVLSPPTPATYTPHHLAERILTSRTALEGERKQVTVLFADLKGSMELLADRDPEEARAILDPVLERMMEAVHRYEGTVNQVMGDGIMALFGAPLAHEDHAVRACYAALALQEAVRQFAEQARHQHGLEIQARVGLNSGEVVVRAIGNDLHMDYSAIGETTHLAARMEQLALPGTIRLAPAAMRLVEGLVQVRALGPMPVKGLTDPVEVYELVGAAPTRTHLQAAATRGLTRFVGRAAELDVLRRTLAQVATGRGQVVAVIGEPGVGKSRLVWEFSHSHRTQGWLVLETGSVSYGKATSYLPVIDLLKHYCGIEARDDPRRMREKATGKLLTLDPTLQSTLPAFLALLDVSVEDVTWQALDPPQRRQRTLEACKRWLLRESQEQPVLLVCEDLHWIDAETQALLDCLVESLPTARLLLLVNYRPEYEHGWGRRTYYQQVRLDPLPAASADELLQALLGDDAGLQALTRLLVERTEGNPFFLEESVRALVETGVLGGERGAYRLARPLGQAQVPATVQAVLAARIDRLAPADKRLLQSAAVIGKDVPDAVLQAIADLPEEALRAGLARLQAAEFLYEAALFPELEYTFKHALTHEVAYGSLLHDRRRTVHAAIVEAIEVLYPNRQSEQVERLAYHAFRGERWTAAVTYLRQASEKATARSAYREAGGHLEQALVALGHVPPSRETSEQAIDVRFDLRSVLFPLGEFDRLLAHLRDAEPIAEALGDRHRLGQFYSREAQIESIAGEPRMAIAAGQRALVLARELGDFVIEVEATYRLGYTYCHLGDYTAASDWLSRSAASLQGELLHERLGQAIIPSVACRGWLAYCRAERGDFAAALAVAQEGVRLAEAERPLDLLGVDHFLGLVHLYRGELETATAVYQRSFALCQTGQVRILFPHAAAGLGYTYALSGQVAAGLPLLEEAIEHAIAMCNLSSLALWTTWLGEAYLLADRPADAAACADRALAIAREHDEQGYEAWALRLHGDIASHAQDASSNARPSPEAEQAQSYYRQALALAEELGMRPLVAHCHLGLGTLYRKVGRDAQAQGELATAADMYRAMEMPFWLEEAETAQAQVPR